MRPRALYRDLRYIVTLGAIIMAIDFGTALLHWWLFLLPMMFAGGFWAGRQCRPGRNPLLALRVRWRRFRYY